MKQSGAECPPVHGASGRTLAVVLHPPDPASARIVAVDVGSVQVGVFIAVVDHTACQGAGTRREVFDRGGDVGRGASFAFEVEGMAPFIDTLQP